MDKTIKQRIGFATDQRGREWAYYVGRGFSVMGRKFRMPLDEAKRLIAAGEATLYSEQKPA